MCIVLQKLNIKLHKVPDTRCSVKLYHIPVNKIEQCTQKAKHLLACGFRQPRVTFA